MAYVLEKYCPKYKDAFIHESSPVQRGISAKLNKLNNYHGSHFFPEDERDKIDSFFNINLENQNFEDDSFDVFIALDVLEHVFRPDLAFQEIFRTLKPGGLAFLTFPIQKHLVDGLQVRALSQPEGIVYLLEPEFHGNPIDEKGSLVTIDYGYDIHQQISMWTRFNVEIIRFSSLAYGIVGEFTEVIVCKK